jgi:hypothetical protein
MILAQGAAAATVVTPITAAGGIGTYSPEPLLRRHDDRMDRLIRLLDDLDDLLSPTFSLVTHAQWLRGAAVLALVLLITRTGASWQLAAMLAMPALPLADLAQSRLRRALPSGLQMPRAPRSREPVMKRTRGRVAL